MCLGEHISVRMCVVACVSVFFVYGLHVVCRSALCGCICVYVSVYLHNTV